VPAFHLHGSGGLSSKHSGADRRYIFGLMVRNAKIAISLSLGLLLLAVPSSSFASTWDVYTCGSTPVAATPQVPAENNPGQGGWVSSQIGSPGGSSSATVLSSCDQASIAATLGDDSVQPTGTAETLRFDAPTGSAIVGGSLSLSSEAAQAGFLGLLGGSGAIGGVFVASPANTSADTVPGGSCGGAGCGSLNVGVPDNNAGSLFVNIACVLSNRAGQCPNLQTPPTPSPPDCNGDICLYSGTASQTSTAIPPDDGSVQVTGADIALSDSNAVSVQNLSDGSVSTTPLSGSAEFSFTSSETAGPGISGATLLIDGKPVTSNNPDSNNQSCVNVPAPGEKYGYTSAQPCDLQVYAGFALDTTLLADGSHTATVVASDAAGNTGSASITFTTNNGNSPQATPGGSGPPGSHPGPHSNLKVTVRGHKLNIQFGSTAGVAIGVYQKGRLVKKLKTGKGGRVSYKLASHIRGQITVKVGSLSKTVTVK